MRLFNLSNLQFVQLIFAAAGLVACSDKKNNEQIITEINNLDLTRGDIALCSSRDGEFGTVSLNLSCSDKVRANMNLGTALLHSFEYTEAEKVFAKVIDEDPRCVMAYWGVAMSNFHPLWEVPAEDELKKGERVIALARSLTTGKSFRESDYLEAIGAFYEHWDSLDHSTRVNKFVTASENVYKKYPEDTEAAIFYALALRAAADPKDKTFEKQKNAGNILTSILEKNPNHPGISHYIIHTFDYPELATLALPAARKYAAIAASSAHAQHMPSHIFTRLGLWDEGIQSNLNSVTAAKCYAENVGMKGHWDEELHGLDYLLYGYLQKADDQKAAEQIKYLKSIDVIFPQSSKVAYSMAAMPTRYALERKNWKDASELTLNSSTLPWEKFPWEKANIHFGRILGAVHLKKTDLARKELKALQDIYSKLAETKQTYKANVVDIQIKAAEGWIAWSKGKEDDAIALMKQAADMEDATEKHPVTPGEVIPARELLGDLYLTIGQHANALNAYESDLKRHPNRFNGLYAAGMACEKLNDHTNAAKFYQNALDLTEGSSSERPEIIHARSFVATNN
ncbi:MAG: tetratricopeptide repeat protein [Chryseolinea sp.]